MGIHRYDRGTCFRMKRAHLVRRENGDIYASYIPKKEVDFEYCFIGSDINQLTLNDKIIDKHPKFKHINHFEEWCMKYCAEHF